MKKRRKKQSVCGNKRTSTCTTSTKDTRYTTSERASERNGSMWVGECVKVTLSQTNKILLNTPQNWMERRSVRMCGVVWCGVLKLFHALFPCCKCEWAEWATDWLSARCMYIVHICSLYWNWTLWSICSRYTAIFISLSIKRINADSFFASQFIPLVFSCVCMRVCPSIYLSVYLNLCSCCFFT